MKIVVVGGGSTYTPELIDGIARLRDELPVSEIALVDPHDERRELLAAVSRRILAKQEHPARVVSDQSLEQAAEDAAVVLVQLRVGGQAARARDESWPLECGCIGQETTGAGGLAKALRTVPVVLDVADRVRRVNPEAWLIDFTNPVGIVTRALLEAGHRAIGLCNVAIGLERFFAARLDVSPARIRLDHVGLNHLTWERAVRVLPEGATGAEPGEDVLPRLLAEEGELIAKHLHHPLELVRSLGALPSYYLRYYYEHDTVVEEQRHSRSRAQQVADMERELLGLYADPRTDSKPELLGQRGGAFYSEAAVGLVASLTRDSGDVHVVNMRNNGVLPFLPDDMVIEGPAYVGAAGVRALPTEPLAPALRGLVAHVADYERLALEAALLGGRSRVVSTLLAHPLIGQWEPANVLADRLVAENSAFLRWT